MDPTMTLRATAAPAQRAARMTRAVMVAIAAATTLSAAGCAGETGGQGGDAGSGTAGDAASGATLGRAAAGPAAPRPGQPFVLVLGVGQDGGYPQAGMKDPAAWDDDTRRRLPTSLAIVDPASGERWLVEATPALPEQLRRLDRIAPADGVPGLAGVLITHAHVGHYLGLAFLGREVIGAAGVPVFAMPRLRAFLRANGPWDQLVRLANIEIRDLEDGVAVPLNARIRVTPIRVPHRDEYSETVGFRIDGPERSVFFLPDIDKWEAWDARGTRIEDVIESVDVAYLDATFYADGEVPGRDMADIPHPFVTESMARFATLPDTERAKIRFIHLNRTNPIGWRGTPEREAVERAGFKVAEEGERIGL
jgi:pyrroloquinoline quinone biosynthesis protein B